MKTKLFLLSMITVFFTSISYSQDRRHRKQNRNNHHSLFTYVVNGSYPQYRYSGNRYSDGYRRSDYDRYDWYFDRMSRSDRRCLRDLIDKLEQRKRRAWENGYISDREDRRIREVEEDIDRLLYKYRRNDRYRDSRRGSGTRLKCR